MLDFRDITIDHQMTEADTIFKKILIEIRIMVFTIVNRYIQLCRANPNCCYHYNNGAVALIVFGWIGCCVRKENNIFICTVIEHTAIKMHEASQFSIARAISNSSNTISTFTLSCTRIRAKHSDYKSF